jgi:hypothetical protein
MIGHLINQVKQDIANVKKDIRCSMIDCAIRRPESLFLDAVFKGRFILYTKHDFRSTKFGPIMLFIYPSGNLNAKNMRLYYDKI